MPWVSVLGGGGPVVSLSVILAPDLTDSNRKFLMKRKTGVSFPEEGAKRWQRSLDGNR